MDIGIIKGLILSEATAGATRLTAYHDSKISQGYRHAGSLRNDKSGIAAHAYTVGKGKKQHQLLPMLKMEMFTARQSLPKARLTTEKSNPI